MKLAVSIYMYEHLNFHQAATSGGGGSRERNAICGGMLPTRIKF